MNKWLTISLLLIGCASQKVVSFVNEGVPFANYHTFAVVNYKLGNTPPSEQSASIYEAIEEKIVAEMNFRKYLQENKQPDILARYEIISNQKTDVSISNPYPYGYIMPIITSRSFLESTLLIELNDFKTKKLIWQASIDLNQYGRDQNIQKVIDQSVSKLFENYLYTAGSASPNPSLTNTND
ncbi:DUF4136 domain-containing protein [Marinoscillum sp. MHG1-6]|uniref:DUF4136 domain-containing protein n=1 Tax=Marinoscillum sp. MHG1-6 TaxID=2959627 RepID=UPI002157B3E4|nr:DUF4136 domain-containing protein [Marinoscillum sp. MHG1-6]